MSPLHYAVPGRVGEGRFISRLHNSKDTPVDTTVVLRGDKKLELWNPHNGERQDAGATNSEQVTKVHLALAPATAVFYVGQ